jgi:hypothetical protein
LSALLTAASRRAAGIDMSLGRQKWRLVGPRNRPVARPPMRFRPRCKTFVSARRACRRSCPPTLSCRPPPDFRARPTLCPTAARLRRAAARVHRPTLSRPRCRPSAAMPLLQHRRLCHAAANARVARCCPSCPPHRASPADFVRPPLAPPDLVGARRAPFADVVPRPLSTAPVALPTLSARRRAARFCASQQPPRPCPTSSARRRTRPTLSSPRLCRRRPPPRRSAVFIATARLRPRRCRCRRARLPTLSATSAVCIAPGFVPQGTRPTPPLSPHRLCPPARASRLRYRRRVADRCSPVRYTHAASPPGCAIATAASGRPGALRFQHRKRPA